MPKYPKIIVRIIGKDSNVFGIIGKVSAALKKAKVPKEEVSKFTKDAFQCHSYDDVLNLVMDTVEVC